MSDWYIWRPGTMLSDENRAAWLDRPPPWRKPQVSEQEVVRRQPPEIDDLDRATRYVPTGGAMLVNHVNVALHLRRPLLVTGPPGIGKSSLAWHLAWGLGLGRPLVWEIGSRTTRQDGLYHYDAVSHLQSVRAGREDGPDAFIRLGPLGTALLPTGRPRVLLVDELDKASYDLPNDLLHVFEEGRFDIPELDRLDRVALVSPHDRDRRREGEDRVPVLGGTVRCRHHPVVIITSNQERDFPEAFRRRCVPVELQRPPVDELERIAASWFGEGSAEARAVGEFLRPIGEDDPGYADQSIDVMLQALLLERGRGADRSDVVGALRRRRDG